ncbi:hypothetical protein CDD83_9244 [Cordyceps sp. RAO-2017]|nr:hypothetical protein CDD83_9244 [Cordyceps sp. RAO-2017]
MLPMLSRPRPTVASLSSCESGLETKDEVEERSLPWRLRKYLGRLLARSEWPGVLPASILSESDCEWDREREASAEAGAEASSVPDRRRGLSRSSWSRSSRSWASWTATAGAPEVLALLAARDMVLAAAAAAGDESRRSRLDVVVARLADVTSASSAPAPTWRSRGADWTADLSSASESKGNESSSAPPGPAAAAGAAARAAATAGELAGMGDSAGRKLDSTSLRWRRTASSDMVSSTPALLSSTAVVSIRLLSSVTRWAWASRDVAAAAGDRSWTRDSSRPGTTVGGGASSRGASSLSSAAAVAAETRRAVAGRD